MENIMRDPHLRASAKFVYEYLYRLGAQQKPYCPSQDEIAVAIGMSRHTVMRALKTLQMQGYAEVVRRGQGKTNVYRISALTPRLGFQDTCENRLEAPWEDWNEKQH